MASAPAVLLEWAPLTSTLGSRIVSSAFHTSALTLDRVFDVVPSTWGRAGPPCTLLGVEAGGVRHFSIRVDGRPAIRSGVRIIALFRGDTDDWKQVVGWVDMESKEIIRAYPPTSWFSAVLLVLVVCAWLPFAIFLALHGVFARADGAGVLLGTAVAFTIAVSSAMRVKQSQDANNALTQTLNALAA